MFCFSVIRSSYLSSYGFKFGLQNIIPIQTWDSNWCSVAKQDFFFLMSEGACSGELSETYLADRRCFAAVYMHANFFIKQIVDLNMGVSSRTKEVLPMCVELV